MQRIREENDGDSISVPSPGTKHQLADQGGPDPKRRASSVPGQNQPIGSPPPKPAGQPADASKPLEKGHCDSIVNYLLRLACQVSDAQAGTGNSPGEMLSRRCVALLKMALKPDTWPNCDLKLSAFEKILAGPQGVDSNQVTFNFENSVLLFPSPNFLVTDSSGVEFVDLGLIMK